MAFIADLNENEQNILFTALNNYINTPIQLEENQLEENIPNFAPHPPSFPTLGPSMNTAAEESARQQINNLIGEGIVEAPGTVSFMTITPRDDRYFFIRNNDFVYKISTNRDLTIIYEVNLF